MLGLNPEITVRRCMNCGANFFPEDGEKACSEECLEELDDRYWDGVAQDERERARQEIEDEYSNRYLNIKGF